MAAEELSGLELALCKESFQYLLNEDTDIAPEIEKAVARGKSPDQIYFEALKTVGEHRRPLALRCKNAARYLHHKKIETTGS